MKPHRLRVDLEKHICTETKVADIDRLPTETTLGEANFQLSFYDDLSRLAKVCIEHGVLRSKDVTRETVAPHRLSATTKETIFPSHSNSMC